MSVGKGELNWCICSVCRSFYIPVESSRLKPFLNFLRRNLNQNSDVKTKLFQGNENTKFIIYSPIFPGFLFLKWTGLCPDPTKDGKRFCVLTTKF